MSRINDIEVIIFRYLDGEASEEDIRILQEWVSSSGENKEKLLAMQNLWEMSHPRFEPAAINTAVAHEKVARRIMKFPKVPFRIAIQRVAALLFLPLLAVSLYLYSPFSEPDEELCHEVFTPYNTWSRLNLPDGSKVWLNAGSSIKYPTRFRNNERTVSIEGEAYFEVESDRKHPFVVRAGDMTVKATGTQFNVNHYAKDSIASVVLVSGRVSVAPDDKGTPPVMLAPGEILSYNRITRSQSVATTNPEKWSSWREGITVFRDDPLDFVFKRLGQTYNVDFIIKDAGVKEYLYRATFEGESLDEILNLIQMSVPVEYKEISNRRSGNMPTEKKQIEIHKKK